VLEYREGIHIGYRAWARSDDAPAYSFGHGLGYTNWEYLALEPPAPVRPGDVALVRVRVRNGRFRRGREVVQVYLSRPESAVERPELWLAGFASVEAEPGEEAWADVELAPRALEHWDDARGWAIEPGIFDVHAGSSAADLPLDGSLTVCAPAAASG
jgi:beta-glucosidase